MFAGAMPIKKKLIMAKKVERVLHPHRSMYKHLNKKENLFPEGFPPFNVHVLFGFLPLSKSPLLGEKD